MPKAFSIDGRTGVESRPNESRDLPGNLFAETAQRTDAEYHHDTKHAQGSACLFPATERFMSGDKDSEEKHKKVLF